MAADHGAGLAGVRLFMSASIVILLSLTTNGTNGNYYSYPCPLVSATSDMSGDGTEDTGVTFSPVSGFWHLGQEWLDHVGLGGLDNAYWGTYGDVPAAVAHAYYTVYRPSTGSWHSRPTVPDGRQLWSVQWGALGDIPVPADYDGDGVAEVAVWPPTTGRWFILKRTSPGIPLTPPDGIEWGSYGDCPVPGRVGASSKASLNVWRPSTGTWYPGPTLDGPPVAAPTQLGRYGDLPLLYDVDGNGTGDFLVFRPSDGTWRTESSVVPFGQTGDIPVPTEHASFVLPTLFRYTVFRPIDATFYVCLGPSAAGCASVHSYRPGGEGSAAFGFVGRDAIPIPGGHH